MGKKYTLNAKTGGFGVESKSLSDEQEHMDKMQAEWEKRCDAINSKVFELFAWQIRNMQEAKMSKEEMTHVCAHNTRILMVDILRSIIAFLDRDSDDPTPDDLRGIFEEAVEIYAQRIGN